MGTYGMIVYLNILVQIIEEMISLVLMAYLDYHNYQERILFIVSEEKI